MPVARAAARSCPLKANLVRSLQTLTERADFVAASKALRQGMPGLHLQARKRALCDEADIRVGFTCSKKVGNAVARNRAKRRLREVARMVLPQFGKEGWDYVLIGRAGATANRPFDLLKNDLRLALERVHS